LEAPWRCAVPPKENSRQGGRRSCGRRDAVAIPRRREWP
jgi:hypothetical protein